MTPIEQLERNIQADIDEANRIERKRRNNLAHRVLAFVARVIGRKGKHGRNHKHT